MGEKTLKDKVVDPDAEIRDLEKTGQEQDSESLLKPQALSS